MSKAQKITSQCLVHSRVMAYGDGAQHIRRRQLHNLPYLRWWLLGGLTAHVQLPWLVSAGQPSVRQWLLHAVHQRQGQADPRPARLPSPMLGGTPSVHTCRQHLQLTEVATRVSCSTADDDVITLPHSLFVTMLP